MSIGSGLKFGVVMARNLGRLAVLKSPLRRLGGEPHQGPAALS